MRFPSLLLLSLAVLLLAACGVGYNFNPQAVDCNSPEGAQLCHPNFVP
jgi:uncharacterized lipoprotein